MNTNTHPSPPPLIPQITRGAEEVTPADDLATAGILRARGSPGLIVLQLPLYIFGAGLAFLRWPLTRLRRRAPANKFRASGMAGCSVWEIPAHNLTLGDSGKAFRLK